MGAHLWNRLPLPEEIRGQPVVSSRAKLCLSIAGGLVQVMKRSASFP